MPRITGRNGAKHNSARGLLSGRFRTSLCRAILYAVAFIPCQLLIGFLAFNLLLKSNNSMVFPGSHRNICLLGQL